MAERNEGSRPAAATAPGQPQFWTTVIESSTIPVPEDAVPVLFPTLRYILERRWQHSAAAQEEAVTVRCPDPASASGAFTTPAALLLGDDGAWYICLDGDAQERMGVRNEERIQLNLDAAGSVHLSLLSNPGGSGRRRGADDRSRAADNGAERQAAERAPPAGAQQGEPATVAGTEAEQQNARPGGSAPLPQEARTHAAPRAAGGGRARGPTAGAAAMPAESQEWSKTHGKRLSASEVDRGNMEPTTGMIGGGGVFLELLASQRDEVLLVAGGDKSQWQEWRVGYTKRSDRLCFYGMKGPYQHLGATAGDILVFERVEEAKYKICLLAGSQPATAAAAAAAASGAAAVPGDSQAATENPDADEGPSGSGGGGGGGDAAEASSDGDDDDGGDGDDRARRTTRRTGRRSSAGGRGQGGAGAMQGHRIRIAITLTQEDLGEGGVRITERDIQTMFMGWIERQAAGQEWPLDARDGTAPGRKERLKPQPVLQRKTAARPRIMGLHAWLQERGAKEGDQLLIWRGFSGPGANMFRFAVLPAGAAPFARRAAARRSRGRAAAVPADDPGGGYGGGAEEGGGMERGTEDGDESDGGGLEAGPGGGGGAEDEEGGAATPSGHEAYAKHITRSDVKKGELLLPKEMTEAPGGAFVSLVASVPGQYTGPVTVIREEDPDQQRYEAEIKRVTGHPNLRLAKMRQVLNAYGLLRRELRLGIPNVLLAFRVDESDPDHKTYYVRCLPLDDVGSPTMPAGERRPAAGKRPRRSSGDRLTLQGAEGAGPSMAGDEEQNPAPAPATHQPPPPPQQQPPAEAAVEGQATAPEELPRATPRGRQPLPGPSPHRRGAPARAGPSPPIPTGRPGAPAPAKESRRGAPGGAAQPQGNGAGPSGGAAASGPQPEALPAASIAHLHGYLGATPPPAPRPGESLLCGCVHHPDVAPAVAQAMADWEARLARPLARTPIPAQITVPGLTPGCGAPAGEDCPWRGLESNVIAWDVARLLGLDSDHLGKALPDRPVGPRNVEPRQDPARGGLGLFATQAMKRSSVIDIVCGYVMAQASHGEEFAEMGFKDLTGPVRQELDRRGGGGGPVGVDVAVKWGLLASSFRVPYVGHLSLAPAAYEGLPPLELHMLGFGNLTALVNDPRVWDAEGKASDAAAAKAANCVLVPVSVRGLILLALVALRDIAQGEQLLRDYGADWWREYRGRYWSVLQQNGLPAQTVLHGPDAEEVLGRYPPAPPAPQRVHFPDDLREGGGARAAVAGAGATAGPVAGAEAGAGPSDVGGRHKHKDKKEKHHRREKRLRSRSRGRDRDRDRSRERSRSRKRSGGKRKRSRRRRSPSTASSSGGDSDSGSGSDSDSGSGSDSDSGSGSDSDSGSGESSSSGGSSQSQEPGTKKVRRSRRTEPPGRQAGPATDE